MIEREFVENNLLRTIDYLPEIINYEKHYYYLKIERIDNTWFIVYCNDYLEKTIIDAQEKDFIQVIIDIIEQVNVFIPDFINNLMGI